MLDSYAVENILKRFRSAVLTTRPGTGTGPWTVWYWTVDHLVPDREPFGTGPWSIWDWAVDHLVPNRGPFATGPWTIWYWTVDHLLPIRTERIKAVFCYTCD